MHVITHFLRWSVGAAPADTQTSVEERAALGRFAAGKRTLVEVGVWHGVTTSLLKKAMDPSGVLYAIDPYPTGRLGISLHQVIAHREVSSASGGRVEWLRTTGKRAAAGQIRPDFVFIDGDHSYDGLGDDWRGWSPHVVAGGIMALHDSRSTEAHPTSGAGSVRFTEAEILDDPRFEVVDVVDTLTVLRRNADNPQ